MSDRRSKSSTGSAESARRLLKTVARQTLESRAEELRRAVGRWRELGEAFVFVEVFVDDPSRCSDAATW